MCARVLLPGADVADRGIHARLDRLERRIGMTGLSAAPAAPPTTAQQRPRVEETPPLPAARPAPVTPQAGSALVTPTYEAPEPAAVQEPSPEPPASAAPAPAPESPGSVLSVTEVRRLWPEVLEEVKGKRRFTWILLSQNAQVAELRNGVLLLTLSNPGARDSFSRGGSEDVLHEALVVVLGADFKIETMVESGSAGPAPSRPAPVSEDAARSWNAPAPAAADLPPAEAPTARPAATTTDPAGRDQARQSIRPTRTGQAASADDERDVAATRHDSDLEESTESHTELLARHLGAEIIAEEEHGA